ncbi:MAG: ABC transporter permease [Dehalococcoidia bacterium]
MTQDVEALGTVGARPQENTVGRRLKKSISQWRKYPLGIIGLTIIILIVLIAVFAPVISPHQPREFAGRPLEGPSLSFPMGTNNLGQDVLARAIYGAQVSIAVGFSAAVMAVFAGTFLGIVSGYVGGWVDLLIQRGLEVLASFPGLVLALVMIAAIGQPRESGSNIFVLAWQLRSLELAIALAFIFGNMRVIRSAVLTERSLPYIEAARSIGCSPVRILGRHILPNVLAYVIVSFSTIIGIVILIEASLSFLGYGVSITTPSWGIDLSNRNREYFLQAPWLIFGPGIALSMTVLGFNFLGDALRDMLDPRLRGSR